MWAIGIDIIIITCDCFQPVAQETFISEVEIIRSEMESQEVVVEGEYASEQTMTEWGFSEYLV